ncbi:oligosaccharide flippase family protein [Bacteroides gallinaceum]|uniref:oligosaccharide flippase family protein n=1 Tax=Bacteroides gallinaceum TaxID=1462571 RepID=UPI00195BA556|nr:oligosaccharide flippase family protein [Bacteroides gallinaceum]MBM6657747.1 oligosaccharide flippase family protein [Bacteroides gallinaceum]
MSVNQLKAGAVLSYISIALNNVIGLLYTPYMLRMLGQNEYGLYSLVASVVSYLTVLDLGFANAIVRYTAKFRAEGKVTEQYEMFGMFFVLYCLIGVVTFIIGLGLCFNVEALFGTTMSNEDLEKIRIMMFLMVFNLAFTFPMSIWGAIITAYENFVFQKMVNIVRIILNPIVMVVLLYWGYKAIAMVVVLTLFNMATLLINAWFCKSNIKIKIRFAHFKWGFLREVSIYSFWIFLNTIMDRIYWNTGQFILGIYNGATAIAIYAVAIQLVHIFINFSTAITGVFLPKVTALVTKQNSEKEVSDLFVKTGRAQYLIMLFVLIGFILFGKQFIVLWAGADYVESYTITLLFFLPLIVPLIQNLGITILQARNQMKFRSLFYTGISILSLGISIPLAKAYGGIGCAIGTSIALIAGQIVGMNIYYYKKIHIDIPLFWKEIGKMSIAPIAFAMLCWFLLKHIDTNNVVSLTLAIITFTILYQFVIWFMSMNSYEKNLISSPVIMLYHKIIRK